MILSKKAQNGNTTNSSANPQTVPTEQGGVPIEKDKASVGPSKVQPTVLLSAVELRGSNRKPNEGPQLKLDTRPGVFPDIPYTRAGSKTASQFDRNYSSMCDTQTSPGNEQNLQPVGSAPLTGASGEQTYIEGPPLAKKKRKGSFQEASFPEVHFVKPRKYRPVEDLTGETSDEFASDSTRILPSRKNLVPAMEVANNEIAFTSGGTCHADVIQGLAGEILQKYVGGDVEQAIDEAVDSSLSSGFYDAATKTYYRRSAGRLLRGAVTKLDVELPTDVSFDMLWEYLDEHYHLKYLIDSIPNGAAVYTDETGITILKQLLNHYWEIAGPGRLVRVPKPTQQEPAEQPAPQEEAPKQVVAQVAPPEPKDLEYEMSHSFSYGKELCGGGFHFSSPEQAFDDALVFTFGNGSQIVFRFRKKDKHGAINSANLQVGKHGKYLYDIVYDYLRENGFYVEPDAGYTGSGVARRMQTLKRQLEKHGDEKHWDVGFASIKDSWKKQFAFTNSMLANGKSAPLGEEELNNGMQAVNAAEAAWPALAPAQKAQQMHSISLMFSRLKATALIKEVENYNGPIASVEFVNNNLVFKLKQGKQVVYAPKAIAANLFQNPQNAYETIKEVAPQLTS